jgi:predicted O-methyltransferase YrrM
MRFNDTLEEIFRTGKLTDSEGKITVIDDMISREEAGIIYEMIKKSNAKITLEVGLAHGVSALVFCQALNDLNISGHKHYAIDPNQYTQYKGAAVSALKMAGYENFFELLEGPTHLEMPAIINSNVKLDCAFIDGWHTFDYTLVDFFLIDKILKPGGYVAFHDVYGRSKQRVINFVLSHRKYEIARDLMQFPKEPFVKTLKFFLWRIYKSPELLFSWYHWQFQRKNSSGLIVLKKLEQFEPKYDFYKNF